MVASLILFIILLLPIATLNACSIIPYAFAAVPDFNIAAVGDWGCNNNTMTKTVNNIVGKNTEITLGLGDNSYGTTADCWFSKISPIDGQMHTAIGNHDDESTQLLAQYLNHYNMQQQYFSFNYQSVHFLVMSTEMPYAIGSAQYNFVQDDLQTAICTPGIKWIIVAFHRNAYLSPNSSVTALADLREIYHPIFEDYGVDLVLQAHTHSYERSYPLTYNLSNSSSPIRDNSSTNDYIDPPGQIFATVGTGGAFFHTFSSKDPAFVTQSNNIFGFLNIDITNEGGILNATFFGNDGTIRDHFSIKKTTSPVC
jgi:hypothetical protein